MAERKNEAKWIESRKRWQINVQNDGKRRTFTSSVPGKKGKIEAEKKADKWLTENTQNENIRLKNAWSDFLEEIKLLGSHNSYIKYEQLGRLYILPGKEHKKVSNLTIQDYQDCINAAYKKGLSLKTCKNIRGAITALYGYVHKKNIPMKAPENLIIPNDAPVKEKNILQPDELKTLFREDTVIIKSKETFAFFIYAWRFMILTGLRRGELCGLKKTDIKNNVLYIQRSVNDFEEITQGKTKNAKRKMLLPEPAKNVIEQQKNLLKENAIVSPYLFPDEEGNLLNPQHLYKKWNTYRRQHGIICTLHELRHTMISIAKSDVPEPLLKQIVGHSKSMDTFGVYGHSVNGDLQRTADILTDLFSTYIN